MQKLIYLMLLVQALLIGRVSAAVMVTVAETGGDVVFSANGTLDLTDLSVVAAGTSSAFLFYYNSTDSVWALGASPSSQLDVTYFGGFTKVGGNFLSGPLSITATSGTGTRFGIDEGIGSGRLIVPDGFAGGSVSATSVYASTDFATLGLVQGTYQWQWGTGPTADFITMNVVPEPGSFTMVLSAAAVCAASLRRRSHRIRR